MEQDKSGSTTNSAPRLRTPGVAQGMTLILAAALPVMGAVLLSPAIPKMLEIFGLSGVDPYLVTTAIVAPAACVGLVCPFIGPVVDLWGRRRAMIGALTLYGFFGMAPLFLSNIFAIIAARFALGVTEAVILTANLALLGDYYEGERRVKWLATQSSALPIFGALFFLVGGVLSATSWREPFTVYGFAFIILLLAVVYLFDVAPTRAQPNAYGAENIQYVSGRMPRSFRLLCVITLMSLTLFFIVPIEFAVLLNADSTIPTFLAGTLMAITAVGNAIGAYSFRYLSMFSTYLLLGGAFAIAGTGLFVASTSSSPIGMTAAGFINQLGCGVVIPTLASAALKTLPAEKRGTGVSRWWSCYYVGNFLSPMGVVYAIERAGTVRHGFMWLSFINLAFAMIIWVFYLLRRLVSRVPRRSSF